MTRSDKQPPRRATGKRRRQTTGSAHRQDRQLSVRAVRRKPPDLRKLSRAIVAAALARAEADAQAEADAEMSTQSATEPRTDHD